MINSITKFSKRSPYRTITHDVKKVKKTCNRNAKYNVPEIVTVSQGEDLLEVRESHR